MRKARGSYWPRSELVNPICHNDNAGQSGAQSQLGQLPQGAKQAREQVKLQSPPVLSPQTGPAGRPRATQSSSDVHSGLRKQKAQSEQKPLPSLAEAQPQAPGPQP